MKNSLFVFIAAVCFCFTTTGAYSVPRTTPATTATRTSCDRRQVFSFIAAAGIASAFTSQKDAAWGFDDCSDDPTNCVMTTWTPPAGTSPSQVYETVKNALQSFPQQGQATADVGNFQIVEDNALGRSLRLQFATDPAKAAVASTTYSSRRSGNTGGHSESGFSSQKGFDELRVQVDGDGTVKIRSNSRGKTDTGVNQKRITFVSDAISKQGWSSNRDIRD